METKRKNTEDNNTDEIMYKKGYAKALSDLREQLSIASSEVVRAYLDTVDMATRIIERLEDKNKE